MRKHPVLTLVRVALTAVFVAGACSDDSDNSSGSTTAKVATTAKQPTTTASVAVLPPIIISGAGDKTARIGDNLDVVSPGVTGVSTDNEAVLEVSQPHTEGGASFNGGARVVGAGEAVLVVAGADGTELYRVNVTGAGS